MSNDGYGIGRPTLTLAQVGSGTSVTKSGVNLNGELWQVTTKAPALTSGTAQVTLIDSDGATVFTGTATAANAIQADIRTTPIMLSGLYTVTVTYSASQTNLTTNLSFLIKKV